MNNFKICVTTIAKSLPPSFDTPLTNVFHQYKPQKAIVIDLGGVASQLSYEISLSVQGLKVKCSNPFFGQNFYLATPELRCPLYLSYNENT